MSIRSRFIQLLVIWPDPIDWPTDPPNHPHIHPRVGGWVGCLYKSWIFKQNWITSIRSRFIQFLVIWPDPTHWPTHPPNHPHPPMGRGVSTNHKSSNRIELSWFSQQFLNFKWFDLNPPINPPTHPNQIIHPPMGGEVSTDFKSSNRIEISRLVQVLLNFEWFQGSPPGGWGVGGWEWGVVRGCIPPMCTCMRMHACARAPTRVWHHREFPGIPPMGAAICMKLSCLPHVHVRAFACMCTCVEGTPQPPPIPINPPPTPRAAGSPKHQNSISPWTNRDNSILFEDSLPLNIPELI